MLLVQRKSKKKENSQRRQRTTFTSDQTLSLELEYGRTEYITRARRWVTDTWQEIWQLVVIVTSLRHWSIMYT